MTNDAEEPTALVFAVELSSESRVVADVIGDMMHPELEADTSYRRPACGRDTETLRVRSAWATRVAQPQLENEHPRSHAERIADTVRNQWDANTVEMNTCNATACRIMTVIGIHRQLKWRFAGNCRRQSCALVSVTL
jgi:hypothetical protein